jgi:acyl-CoA hydrolase
MSMAIEVRAGSIQSGELQPVTHCVALHAAVDDAGQPRAVDAWTPETRGDIALAQRVKGHIDAEHAAQ